MKILEFRIQNFKGINDATVKLTGNEGSIYTLVGLNESGKTTVLQAINFFNADVDGIHAIAQGPLAEVDDHLLVPKKTER